MTILGFQQAMADLLAADAWFAARGVVALAEDSKDVDPGIAEAMAGVGICAVVMTPRLAWLGVGADGADLWEVSELSVAVRENVPANRARPDFGTALDAAVRAGRVLRSDICSPQSVRQGEYQGMLLAEAVFATSCAVSTSTEPTEG
jgi:hypothetical protein